MPIPEEPSTLSYTLKNLDQWMREKQPEIAQGYKNQNSRRKIYA